jgi:lysyl endopeptidase
MKKRCFIVVLLVSQIVLGQVTNEATPRGWGLTFKSHPQKVIMPSIDLQALEQEDALMNQGLPKPYRFGKKIPVDLNLFNSGQWTELENGGRIWRLNIESTGARTINFLFDRYDLPEGAEMCLYNKDHTDKIGPYTQKENQEDGILGSWIIYGDNVWIDYYEPAAVRNQGRISIEQVVHGYRGFGKVENDFLKLNESGACNVDIMCNPNQGSTNGQDWVTIRDSYRQAVARVIINGNGLCTGTMINNVREDATPYFYTANHCLGASDGASGSFNAANWVFGFEWFATTPDCATFANTTGPFNPTQVLSGAVLRMNHSFSDTALFQLNQSPPLAWNLYYGGWDRTTTVSTAQLGVHHPSGDIMKLCRNDQAPVAQNITIGGVTAQTWAVADWDYGVTEGGSSGSCLINTNGHIIGELYGGAAACSGTVDNGQPDFYGRMSTAWNGGGTAATRLSSWLDPDSTAANTLTGAFYNILNNKDIVAALSIKIYPNPSTGFVHVILESPASFRIYDLSGKLIHKGSFDQVENQLNIKKLSNGIYFLKVEDGNRTVTERISKI